MKVLTTCEYVAPHVLVRLYHGRGCSNEVAEPCAPGVADIEAKGQSDEREDGQRGEGRGEKERRGVVGRKYHSPHENIGGSN